MATVVIGRVYPWLTCTASSYFGTIVANHHEVAWDRLKRMAAWAACWEASII